MGRVTVLVDGTPVARGKLVGEVYVGRSPECGLSVPDARLSRKHLRIVPTKQGWIAQDLGSRNGTRVAGQIIKQHLLRDGDVLELGGVAIAFASVAADTAILDDEEVCSILAKQDSGAMDAIQETANELASLPDNISIAERESETKPLTSDSSPSPALPAALRPNLGSSPSTAPASTAPSHPRASVTGPKKRNLWEEVQTATPSTPTAKNKPARAVSTSPAKEPAAIKSSAESTSSKTARRVPSWALGCGIGATVATCIGIWFFMRQPAPPQPTAVANPQQSVARANGTYHWDND